MEVPITSLKLVCICTENTKGPQAQELCYIQPRSHSQQTVPEIVSTTVAESHTVGKIFRSCLQAIGSKSALTVFCINLFQC